MDQNTPTPMTNDGQIGFLTLRVRTAGDALPVKDASVTVSNAENGQVLATLITDRSGNTPPLPLPSPPRSTTQTPNGGIPAFRYHVVTDAAGYYSTQNLFVPIYEGVTSIQTVHLTPLPSGTAPYPSELTRYNESQSPDL